MAGRGVANCFPIGYEDDSTGGMYAWYCKHGQNTVAREFMNP